MCCAKLPKGMLIPYLGELSLSVGKVVGAERESTVFVWSALMIALAHTRLLGLMKCGLRSGVCVYTHHSARAGDSCVCVWEGVWFLCGCCVVWGWDVYMWGVGVWL